MPANVTFPTDARALFDAKFPTLQNQVRYRSERWRLSFDDTDDIGQMAALYLWEQCLRVVDPETPSFEISCEMILDAACTSWRRRRRRRPAAFSDLAVDSEIGMPEPAAPNAVIKVDGARLTVADALMDAPRDCHTWETGIRTTEVCRRLGITRERVRQLASRLGGVALRVGKHAEWRFPADVGLGTRGRTNRCGT
jgi:hypothetical protein